MQNIKDGFTGTLEIGDILLPECEDLGFGLIVTEENIEALTSIFATEQARSVLLPAIADSVATDQCITVRMYSVDEIDSAILWLRKTFLDVVWDRTSDESVTIFGDDQNIIGDEDEGLWVLNITL